jgi:hypothetical protein
MVTISEFSPRWIKRQQFLQTPRGTSLMEMEHYDRIAFAYYLVLTCSIVWTVLVVFTRSSGFFHWLFADNLDHPSDSHTWP